MGDSKMIEYMKFDCTNEWRVSTINMNFWYDFKPAGSYGFLNQSSKDLQKSLVLLESARRYLGAWLS